MAGFSGSFGQLFPLGYALAAAVFAALVFMIATLWRQRAKGSAILPVLIASFLSALLLGAFPADGTERLSLPVYFAEYLFDLAWIAFLALEMRGAIAARASRAVYLGSVLLVALLIVIGALVAFLSFARSHPYVLTRFLAWGSMVTSLAGVVVLEQVYRNTRRTQKSGLNYLVVGLGGIFVYDLVMYTANAVFRTDVSLLWTARGYVIAFCAVLIGIAIRKVPALGQGLFFSRHVFYFSSSLVAAIVYLAIVTTITLYLRHVDERWGAVLQVVFVSVALLMLMMLFMTERFRAQAKVVLDKHFFERKYDYRQEWLRLNDTLTSSADSLPPRKRAIKSLAQVVGARKGRLWSLNRATGKFEPVTGWNEPAAKFAIDGHDPLVRFVAETGWVIDLAHPGDESAEFAQGGGSPALTELPADGLLIPLFLEEQLVGFVTLSDLNARMKLNFEDLDLLKTAGSQVASYLAQQESSEKLAESRQFEAYSRFTAYVMHDLKNAIAQQSLVVDNAERHKRNPEFVDDAIATIKGCVVRMRRVLRQLQQQSLDERLNRVDLTKLIMQAESECDDRPPVPVLSMPDVPVVVLANRERLLMAVCHAVRNAQDATPPDGSIGIRLATRDGRAHITIEDTGSGMDDAFVRNRLFRPFDSTKGVEGMGIGAYQVRETLRAIDGDVAVDSAPGRGTRFTMSIPLAPAAEQAAAPRKPAA
ncbi:MAG TPA: XrtA/PEP-CTERM system histidine kinase PrsK [Woeseiaceae bacterium]|nr:XrtA/PEP-CTERM system histidine kinase PrsK [Woeseiaceae bacterium]